eukprot:TRINITY_DN13324_c0_g1_i1.p1 TRINITY_DN13324_c0_g1~~TRINITY_DN13324_c0_g1_i1.p1  ORF type:complete len:228 (-),score=17.76 TRINITY_DN13324_c0_g1_i1:696-1379(-)
MRNINTGVDAVVYNQEVKEIDAFVEEGLVTERHMAMDWWSLFMNRPWLSQEGPVIPVPSLSPNVEWLGGKRFPGGHRKDDPMPRVVISLWRFLWSKNVVNSRIGAALKAFRGICPAAQAQVLALFIAGLEKHARSEEGVPAEASGGIIHWLSQLTFQAWALVYILIFIAEDRADFKYWTTVPGSGIRAELRQRLQHAFLEVKEPELSQWPVGRCASVLNVDIPNAIN